MKHHVTPPLSAGPGLPPAASVQPGDQTTKKRHRLRSALANRAHAELGAESSALDYVCDWIASGKMVTQLATALAEDMGESCSRSFLSLIIHRLAPDATERIASARTIGADAMLERAQELLDDVSSTGMSVAETKLRFNTLLWQASRANRAAYGAQVTNNRGPDIGALHLAALRQQSAP